MSVVVLRLYYKRSTLELLSSGRLFAGAEHRAPDVRFRNCTSTELRIIVRRKHQGLTGACQLVPGAE